MIIAQNEWTSLAIHDCRSGKFEWTSAFNKLCIREERASFGPQALIKLIRTTSLAQKLQNHGWNIENEMIYQWFKQKKKSVLRIRRTIPLHLKIVEKQTFFVWKLTLSAIFWKPPTKSFKPRTEYFRLVLHYKIRFLQRKNSAVNQWKLFGSRFTCNITDLWFYFYLDCK